MTSVQIQQFIYSMAKLFNGLFKHYYYDGYYYYDDYYLIWRMATRALSGLRYYSRRPLPSRGGCDIGPPYTPLNTSGFVSVHNNVLISNDPCLSTDPLSWPGPTQLTAHLDPGLVQLTIHTWVLSSPFFVPLLIRISRAFHESITILWRIKI